jgi:hypothetical protein
MIQFPLPDGGVLAIVEPGNIERLKAGKPLKVGNCLVAFTPDAQEFAVHLGIVVPLPARNERIEKPVHITPEQIQDALDKCQGLPEVLR